ncbi:hypothetical protein AB0M36_06865 [Actinoplanes sp. NPDC051346]|uniref:hypothetical protein n=1 Tax=Actinoplanes sp. NPDC051346 TaxID=3155048 RepID=UPI0034365118
MSGVVLRWVRSGLGATVTQQRSDTANARPPLPMTLRLSRDGARVGQVDPAGLALLGPGDVTGLDVRQVRACWPPPDAAGVSAADLAYVELADPAAPWLVTPFGPDPAGNLTPWLALVVVPQSLATLTGGGALLTLEVPGTELPPWDSLHAWTHVHVGDPAVDASDAAAIRAALARPGTATARLLCPRRLATRTTYLAALVPAFRAGSDAVLGVVPVTPTAVPAWSNTADPVRLPVYHSWRFTTGEAATFEDLAMALRPAAEDVAVGGARRIAVDRAGRSLPDSDPLPIGGALRVGAAPARPPYDAAPLTAEMTSTRDLAAPVWGDWHAEADPPWLRQLNEWPPHRVAAGLGAAAVRVHQEQLMAAAWEQAGQWAEADEQIRHAQAGLSVALRLHTDRLAPLIARPAVLLQVAWPAAARLAVATGAPRSLAGQIASTCLPPAVLGAPARRLFRPGGRIARRVAALRDGIYSRSELLDRYATGQPGAAPDPAPEQVSVPRRGRIPRPPPLGLEPHIAAAAEAWRRNRMHAAAPPACTPADLNALAGGVNTALHPEAPLTARLAARLDTAGSPVTVATAGARISRLRVGPRFDVPLVDLLLEQGTDWLLPGVAELPDDRLVLADPDPAFIEAVAVGANHEVSREFLWRRFPADRGSSAFTRFWDRRTEVGGGAALRDLPDLHHWAGDLGSHVEPAARISVLVARGRLFRDHPGLIIYAHRGEGTPGAVRPAATPDDASWRAATRSPVLTGRTEPDVALFGFPLSADVMRGVGGDPGWFIVLAEPPVGNRYGLSADRATGPLRTWADLSWSDVTVTGGHLDPTTPPATAPTSGPEWAARSDVLAAVLRRNPFRVFLHASRLLP